jgi:hypothetical protein
MSDKIEAKAATESGQPYEKPEVRTEEVFETLAAQCCASDIRCSPAPGTPQTAAS